MTAVSGHSHHSGTLLGDIALAIMAVGQAFAAMTQQHPRPQIDNIDYRNQREDARTQNIWLFGA
jgi:hypothetical protein